MRTVLITGASGGIGQKLAYKFAEGGYDLIIVARSKDILDRLAEELMQKFSIKVDVITADLSQEGEVERLIEELAGQKQHVDILINNAGFGLYGEFIDSHWQDEKEMMMVNMMALTELTKRLLPGMIERRSGKVLNVASTAAFQPGPLMSVYFATKAYVLSFSEALENELEGTGVSVSVLCPGPTDTGFKQRASMEESKLFDRGVMNVDTVADIAYKEMMRGKTLIIPGSQNRALSFMIRFLPRKLVTKTVRKVQGRKKG